MDAFTPRVREWFAAAFEAPTAAQEQAWPAIASGEHVLISAPTGSGKTLAAFLWAIDELESATEREGIGLVYVSPLKALSYDIERNLRAPLRGIKSELTVAVRTGDTPQKERQQMLRHPPDILITTPESLYLMLTGRAQELFARTRWCIVDEIHAVASTKRGAHLALTLERLAQTAGHDVQRIGLSATQNPLEEVGRFMVGPRRTCRIVDTGVRKELDIEIRVPVESMVEPDATPAPNLDPLEGGTEATRKSIWPAIYPELLELIEAHRSTILFVNARRAAERIALRLNEMAGREIARSHHGSLAREERTVVEEMLKAGELPCLVATSSLELGIDMGAVDLVIQVESPKSVARGLQRIGRAGHNVGDVSRGRIFPKFRADLLECAVVASRMRAGLIETTVVPRNALDVLAQQIVAIAAAVPDDGSVHVDDLYALVTSTYSYAELSRAQLENVLDMLDGRYPSSEFSELRPRIIWDRVSGTIRARPGARQLAVTNAGTIPDRGLYAVTLPDGRRVGELDEEMVYEARPGQTFLLGATTWRIEEIGRDRVIVTPAPGPARRRAVLEGRRDRPPPGARGGDRRVCPDRRRRDARATATRLRPRRERRHQPDRLSPRAAAGDPRGAVGPGDRGRALPRRDRRLAAVRAVAVRRPRPRGMERSRCGARIRDELGLEADAIYSDDGIIVHLPDAEEPPGAELALIEPDEVEDMVVGELGGSALFGARFRENAARALLIPRARPGRRTPLWQQRLKSQSLLEVARKYGEFPVVLETYRECLRDVLDVPGLVELLRSLHRREISLVEVETATASPFASSLLFDYVATYMYEGDTPNAERRAAALSLDRDLLRELLGQEELRDLIDPDALARVEDELQCLSDMTRAANRDGTPRRAATGRRPDARRGFVRGRSATRPRCSRRWRTSAARRGCGSRARSDLLMLLILACSATRSGPCRRAGCRPLSWPTSKTRCCGSPVATRATHGPFTTDDFHARYGVDAGAVLRELERDGALVQGELRPGGSAREWCDVEVLRRLRRASLSVLRAEIEPAEPTALARFLPAWQGVDRHPATGAGIDRLREALVPLQGLPLPAEVWERDVLPRRVGAYSAAWIDQLCASGEIVWVGAGALGRNSGRVALYFREDAALLGPPPAPRNAIVYSDAHATVRERLATGACFFTDLLVDLPLAPDELQDALWDLVWAGEVTNDAFAPLRAPRLTLARAQRDAARAARPGRFAARRRGAGGAAQVQGRWSLTVSLFAVSVDPSARRRARAELMLERYGILTREQVLAEGVPGGFSAVYPELSQLETLGVARRGYFVEGLGGAQFALPGAVERLRALRDDDSAPVVLAAVDPAQPYGAALPWPPDKGLRRVAGAYVVLSGGDPILYLERSGRGLITLVASDDPRLEAALDGAGRRGPPGPDQAACAREGRR